MPKHTSSSVSETPLPYSPLTYSAKLDQMAGVALVTAPIGGIGKSTTTEMTSAALQAAETPVFLCEFDQQSPLRVRNKDHVFSVEPAKPGPDADQENLYLVEGMIDRVTAFLTEHPTGLAALDVGANLDATVLTAVSGANLDLHLAKGGRPLLVCVLLSADPATWQPTKQLITRWTKALDNAQFVFVAVDKRYVFSRGLAPERAERLRQVLGDEIARFGVLHMPDISGRTETVMRSAPFPWHEIIRMDPLGVAALTGHPSAGLSTGMTIAGDIEALITQWRGQLQRLSFRC